MDYAEDGDLQRKIRQAHHNHFPESQLSPVVFALYLHVASENLREYVKNNEGAITYYADDIIIIIDKKHISRVFDKVVDKNQAFDQVNK